MFVYKIYRLVTSALNFFSIMYLKSRIEYIKEDENRYVEKLGNYSEMVRPEGKLIWIHVASLGEMNSIISLVEEISKKQKVSFLISSVTLSSANFFTKAGFKENVTHVFAPLDTPQIVERFLDFWNPDIGLFIDSELWPNLITQAAERFKIYNVNARLSEKSAKRWEKFDTLIKYMYGKFTKIMPCSELDYDKILKFAPKEKLKFIGNLKFTAESLSPGEGLEALKKEFENNFVILLASTHSGEEEVIIPQIASWVASEEKIKIVVAPRHVRRGEDVLKICTENNLKAGLRSERADHASCKVYIADTLGEMGIWYRIASMAFIGGSLVKIGGHNIIEATKLKCPVVVGPYTHNFTDVIEAFRKNNGILITNKSDILNNFKLLANDDEFRKQMVLNAFSLCDAGKILNNTIRELEI